MVVDARMTRRHGETGVAGKEVRVSTILFVDDHHSFRTVFAEILRVRGHTVLEACTAADADHAIQGHSCVLDLLVVEAVLGTTNGIKVADHLKSRHPDLRTLYISEESEQKLATHGLLPSDAPFMKKPFGAEELCDKVQALCRGHRAAPS
jgi:two-component system cell cycle sensor histidine kinase/response regulator CckA